MACCVHQASTGDYPPGRGSLTRKLTAKEAKQARDDRYDMTEHFIETLPLLLTKVQIFVLSTFTRHADLKRFSSETARL